jgi:hypothetical protein
MADITRKLSVGEREILRNQRLIMMCLTKLLPMGGKDQERLIARIFEMDRCWQFIASPEERVTMYEPPE